ncbi:2-oxo-4-hydroxy-4-carboxy-5-ureidoimidazoline decarboxylase [Actinomadura kijaniata]|uniref:2-oxo-4-hydroxy-4-carboxy-5-ureidoimidazoline decarboxylase n=1 Tax=Actinomadura kijaniata TaxID=46161 RepID=UPI003F1AB2BC
MAATLERLNALPASEAEAELLTCCASGVWAAAVAADRPYDDLAGLRAAAARHLAALDWTEIDRALAAHPRIGDRVGGGDREARWSRGEQSGMDAAADATRRALYEGNVAYEERFGHVFLICATGLSADRMLASLHERLTHDPDTERAVVRAELAKIVEIRLDKLLSEENA